jgi:FMN-dependent NADH-azoreductase
MAKLLYIIAHPQKVEGKSRSLLVGRRFIDTYKEAHPEDEVVELNLYNTDVPEIDSDVLEGWGKLHAGASFDELTEQEAKKITRINELTEQFTDADKYVFSSPLWNLGVTPKLKAYIDTITVVGKTFKYTENGPKGLLYGKKAVNIVARGGFYSEGAAREVEFCERYITAILSFIGLDVEPIVIEGQDHRPDLAESIINAALEKAAKIAKVFGTRDISATL